jgi:hypothetical protein
LLKVFERGDGYVLSNSFFLALSSMPVWIVLSIFDTSILPIQTDLLRDMSDEAKCCPNTSIRKIVRSVHEATRGVARRIAATPEYVRSRHERKKAEMFFAHLKRILKLDRLRLRGLSGATDEFTLAAAVQNLRRLAKFTSKGHRSHDRCACSPAGASSLATRLVSDLALCVMYLPILGFRHEENA